MKCARFLLVSATVLISLASAVTWADDETSGRLGQLFDEAWEFDLRESREFATYVGDRRYNDRLDHVTPADLERRAEASRAFIEKAEAIDPAELSPEERISRAIFIRLRRDAVSEHDFQGDLMPITGRSGFHISFPELPKVVPMVTPEDYENYIARLSDFHRQADEYIALMRLGIERGMVLPAVVLEGYRESIEPHIVDDPTRSLLDQPFEQFPLTVPPSEHARLREAGRRAIVESVVPGYRAFLEFMTDEYLPAARGSIGASALPRGREYYRHCVGHFTTLDITPEEIHQIGMGEVHRIRNEMQAVIEETGFDGDFAAFVHFLRTDPQFYVDTPERLLKEVSFVLKKMDGQLPGLFGTLPRMSYGIREVPDFIAPRTTTAYYMPPSGDGTRAGFYYVNTYNLKARPLFELEALSLHEAVPGHHLQIARQQELENIPKFQRFAGFTAFIEGWGLYSERLGLEAGFYQDPYSDFGRLSYEMWRACRLVVDTGMHYLGWTRDQAIEFMAENTALTRPNIVNEVDRYIAWPGQALAYKMGELKIRELRANAEQELGADFDVRQFHDVVLGSGAVPLDVLEQNVDVYIEANRAK